MEDLYRKWVVTDYAVHLRRRRERDRAITQNRTEQNTKKLIPKEPLLIERALIINGRE